MGIIGKLVGGTIGFALGGPLGGVAGAVFGHAFDMDADIQTAGQSPASSVEASQLAFFVGTFSMLAKLVQADGRVTRQEMDIVDHLAADELGMTPQNREVAINIFRAALDSPASFEDFATQFYTHFRFQDHLIEMMVEILLKVGIADGALHAAEEALILSAVRIFKFDSSRYEQLKSKYGQTDDRAYLALGCQRDDSDEVIKGRYRHLVQTYHPDKIAGKGLPDEFTQLAQDKFREIQSAYDTIKLERRLR